MGAERHDKIMYLFNIDYQSRNGKSENATHLLEQEGECTVFQPGEFRRSLRRTRCLASCPARQCFLHPALSRCTPLRCFDPPPFDEKKRNVKGGGLSSESVRSCVVLFFVGMCITERLYAESIYIKVSW